MISPTKVIVRKPSSSYKDCVSNHPLHHTVNLELAKEQHREYCEILRELGLEIIELPIKDEYPDSCFVEDNAIVHGKKALITRMGVESRRGEEDEVEITLSKYLDTKRVKAPATIEGGDVIHLPDQLICGVTQRTNLQGAGQLEDWMDIPVNIIENPTIMHLKSYMKYLGKNTLITTVEYENHPLLQELNLLLVPKEEYYSVNCLAVKDTVIMSDKFKFARDIVKDAEFEVITLNMSEFEKCQASLTCLSIIF